MQINTQTEQGCSIAAQIRAKKGNGFVNYLMASVLGRAEAFEVREAKRQDEMSDEELVKSCLQAMNFYQ